MRTNDSGTRTKQIRRANDKRTRVRTHKEHTNKWQRNEQERQKKNKRNATCHGVGLHVLGSGNIKAR